MYVIVEKISSELSIPVFHFASMVDADKALGELRDEVELEGCDPERYDVEWQDAQPDYSAI